MVSVHQHLEALLASPSLVICIKTVEATSLSIESPGRIIHHRVAA